MSRRPVDGFRCCECVVSEPLDRDDIQGLVARGYGALPHAAYLMMQIEDPVGAGRTLDRLADEVTPAGQSPRDMARHVAVTADGVRALIGSPTLLEGFSEPFATGMATEYRSRLLGDVGANDPEGWTWGGPANDPVHVALLLFADSASRLSTMQAEVTATLESGGLSLVAALDTSELSDREHFGFHDGISQPILGGLPSKDRFGDVVRDGEFVLGYVNEYGQRTERPLLRPELDPGRLLPRDADGSGAADLGRNGSYLVFRQLRQDTVAFEAFLDQCSSARCGADVARREHLAAKLVGRWRGTGAPLTLSPDADDPSYARSNDFSYHQPDAQGLRCPVGAHIRRTNPRDSLQPRPGTEASRQVNVRHRLLRRGRSYGPPATEREDDERGLHFLCLNTNLARQFEFVQHSWVNDPSFNGLVGVEDPLVGPRATGPSNFVEPADPVRRRFTGLPQFVQMRGGAYFFLPGIRALRYLATGPNGR